MFCLSLTCLLLELQQCRVTEIISYAGEKDDENRMCEMNKKLAEEDIGDNVESRFMRLERHCWWSSSFFLASFFYSTTLILFAIIHVCTKIR